MNANARLVAWLYVVLPVFSAAGAVVPIPDIPGTAASATYQVRVDSIPVPVNDEGYFDFHTAFFTMSDPVTVEVTFTNGASFSSIHPLRHGIDPSINGDKISFTLNSPLKLVIKAEGALPLALCATPTEEDVPAPADPDVIYFGPGTHEPGVIQPVAGQTVYLAPGALVKGRIETRNATNVTIRGRGTLDARGYSVRGEGTQAIRVERCSQVNVSGIGIRGGTNWQMLFLLTHDSSATHLNLFGKTVNTDGIDIDGVQRFVARDCFIRCEDDGFGWHAISAELYGEPPTRDCLAEDCVIWNTSAGNGLRVGASMETELFENITFRNIDVLEHNGAAIYSDHSDWATCRNIRFENFIDETTRQTIDIFIDKTRYSNSTGYRDERGHYDVLQFIRVTSPGGGIRLAGYDADHRIDNVLFQDCFRGCEPIDAIGDIDVNAYVGPVSFKLAPGTGVLNLAPTDDATIRAAASNQGASSLLLVGDTTNTTDYLRACLSFPLTAPELTGKTIKCAKLELVIASRDTSNGGSTSLSQDVGLHKLAASFTNNGVTWTSRNGSDDWTTPGGDFEATPLVSVVANAGTVSAGDTITFSGTALASAVQPSIGGSIDLIVKLPAEDANRSVFRFASTDNATASRRPRLVLVYSAPPVGTVIGIQ